MQIFATIVTLMLPIQSPWSCHMLLCGLPLHHCLCAGTEQLSRVRRDAEEEAARVKAAHTQELSKLRADVDSLPLVSVYTMK